MARYTYEQAMEMNNIDGEYPSDYDMDPNDDWAFYCDEDGNDPYDNDFDRYYPQV